MKLGLYRKYSILRSFYPAEQAESTFAIDYEKLWERGFRGIIFDIDNTLVGHDEPADERAILHAEKVRALGFKLCIVSNNKEPRVKAFAEALNATYVFDAKKPSRKGYEEAMKRMDTDRSNTVAIGDQLITDIWGANRAGVHNIFVKQLYKKEPGNIVFKRKLEAIIMFFYRHELPDKKTSKYAEMQLRGK